MVDLYIGKDVSIIKNQYGGTHLGFMLSVM